jgi:hypothetical protein
MTEVIALLQVHASPLYSAVTLPGSWIKAGLSNAAPVICFPGALICSAGVNVNQDLKKKNSE